MTKLGKVLLFFKTPDVVYDAKYRMSYGKDDEEKEAIEQVVENVISMFVRYGECITIEVDLDNKTATVKPL